MAHSLSAKKRIRQTETATARNRWRKAQIKDSVKEFLAAVANGDKAKASDAFHKASRTLDRVAAAGTIHRNTASRRKGRLAARLNAMTAKA